jgi:23S rRNA pseudouridine1911/1915/1917 synthase
MASRGAPCLGDAVYGSGAPARTVKEAMEGAGLARQALHAAVLGFVHPITSKAMRFETPPPEDIQALERALAEL